MTAQAKAASITEFIEDSNEYLQDIEELEGTYWDVQRQEVKDAVTTAWRQLEQVQEAT